METAPIAPVGTGFFINGGEAFPGQAYLVTARHVADKVHTPFVIRLNANGGGARLLHFERPSDIEWCFHPDSAVDLAIAPIALPSWAEARGFNAQGLLRDSENIKDIDAGSTVCVIGLFHLHHGKRQNLPITHVGHVAMLPKDELVPVDGKLREGYLIQANAISGCSGSPVVTVRQIGLKTKPYAVVANEGVCMLLGIWSASWKVKGSEVVAVQTDTDDGKGELAPLGMGFVTPLSKLIDILWSDEMRTASGRLNKKLESANSLTFDSLENAPPTKDENPHH